MYAAEKLTLQTLGVLCGSLRAPLMGRARTRPAQYDIGVGSKGTCSNEHGSRSMVERGVAMMEEKKQERGKARPSWTQIGIIHVPCLSGQTIYASIPERSCIAVIEDTLIILRGAHFR